MARVEVKKAAKDYPAQGIKKGDRYYFCAMKTGATSSRIIRSLKPIKRHQTTVSEFYSRLWEIEDERFDGIDEAEGLKEIANELRELGEEQQEKLDNMPEGLQQGDTGQLLEERANGCEEWASEIETVADELESNLEEFDAAIEPWTAYSEALKAFEDAHADWEDEDEDKRGDEPVEPEEPNESLPDCLNGIDLTNSDDVAEARNAMVEEAVSQAQDANPGMN